ncbi:MAG: methyl-accepting chemotaxis protein [Magnetococcales bacterium]|nr:methyl-accepting chemotaxis protein [Magnetococcales bacterium]
MIRLQDIRLRPKLTVLLLLCGLIPVLILWWLRDHQADRSKTLQVTAQLETARSIALTEIKRHLAERRADMEILAQIAAENHQQARGALESLRDVKKERVETFLNTQLNDMVQLAANPDFIKRIAAIDWLFRQAGRKSDDNHWRETVEGYVPPIHSQSSMGLEDLYVISPLGDVVYTLNRHTELGHNIHQKPLKDSPLAQIHRQALEAATIQDPQPHASLFFGAPIKKEGATIGAVIARISRPVLTQLLHSGVDPALRGHLLLAASDGPRSDPPASRPTESLPTAAIQAALDQKTGSGLLTSAAHPPLLAAWAPIQVKGLRWAIVAEKEAARVFAPHPGETRNWLQKFSETAGYYDLFLIHPNGEVFHTSARQADFATNLLTGRYASTNLGHLIQRTLKSQKAGLSDLLPYPPSDNQPAFFMAQPVIDQGQLVLVAALQLAPDTITAMMHQLSQASPYRIFLVGPDEKLRSDAFTDPANPSTATAFIGGAAEAVVSPQALRSALAGETGTLETSRAPGKRVISSFAPLPMDGFTWAVITEIDLEESAPGAHSTPMLLGIFTSVALLTLIGTRMIQRELLDPLNETAFTLNRMASGHFTAQETSSRRDELGSLTRSVVTVSEEVAQAGQRIQLAAEPMALRIRKLASHAMVISRESAAGSDLLADARTAIEEMAGLFSAESNRLIQEQTRLRHEQTRLLHTSERMAGQTAQAITEGKQVVHDSMESWRQLQERLQRLQETTRERLTQATLPPPGHKSADEGGKGSKHGKQEHGKQGHGKEGHGKEGSLAPAPILRVTQEMQSELDALNQLIGERLTAAEGAITALENLLPALPMPQDSTPDTVMTLEHSPERALAALEKLDELLKKNSATAREIILSAKSVFDLATGPLKQATSYFAPQDSRLPDSPLASRPPLPASEMATGRETTSLPHLSTDSAHAPSRTGESTPSHPA